jgi:hypothetical protein
MTTTCGSCTSAAACTALESPQSLHLGGAASAGRARGGLRGGWARAHHTSSGWRLRYPRMCGSDSRSTRIQPASPLTSAPRWETSSSWHKYAFNRKRTTAPGRHVSEEQTTGRPGSRCRGIHFSVRLLAVHAAFDLARSTPSQSRSSAHHRMASRHAVRCNPGKPRMPNPCCPRRCSQRSLPSRRGCFSSWSAPSGEASRETQNKVLIRTRAHVSLFSGPDFDNRETLRRERGDALGRLWCYGPLAPPPFASRAQHSDTGSCIRSRALVRRGRAESTRRVDALQLRCIRRASSNAPREACCSGISRGQMGRSCTLCGAKQAAVLLGPRSARNVGGEEEADAAHAA